MTVADKEQGNDNGISHRHSRLRFLMPAERCSISPPLRKVAATNWVIKSTSSPDFGSDIQTLSRAPNPAWRGRVVPYPPAACGPDLTWPARGWPSGCQAAGAIDRLASASAGWCPELGQRQSTGGRTPRFRPAAPQFRRRVRDHAARAALEGALQKFADETGLTFHIHHYPPGTSKWNKIEHRLFCHITQNWRSRPLADRMTIVELIAATTTGLTRRE